MICYHSLCCEPCLLVLVTPAASRPKRWGLMLKIVMYVLLHLLSWSICPSSSTRFTIKTAEPDRELSQFSQNGWVIRVLVHMSFYVKGQRLRRLGIADACAWVTKFCRNEGFDFWFSLLTRLFGHRWSLALRQQRCLQSWY